jgi:HK97 family phage major capsid protein
MARTDLYSRALKNQQPFSISTALQSMLTGGIDARSRDALLAIGGDAPDPHRIVVPFAGLRRDLAVSGSGGYLAATDTGSVIAALSPVSAIIRNGARVLSNCSGHVSLPRIPTASTGEWLDSEMDTITASAPTVTSLTLKPHTCGALVAMSRLLGLQAPDAEAAVRADLLAVIGTTIDAAIIDGTGSSGQPLGVLRASGIGSQSGTALAWAGILEMRRLVRVGKANEASTYWITDPATAKVLAGRERASGSGHIMEGATIDGRPVIVTSNIPASTLLLIDLAAVWVAFWRAGLEISVDPSTHFKTGVSQIRCMASVDAALAYPATACAATSVT